MVRQVYDQYIDFVSLERDLFSMNMDASYKAFNDPQVTEVRQTLANGEVRLGYSFRLPIAGDNIVLTPFAVAGGAYDSLLATSEAVGVGVGGNLRIWFRQDHYSGPASYFDLTAQYRVKVAGDKRAGGWFFTASVAY